MTETRIVRTYESGVVVKEHTLRGGPAAAELTRAYTVTTPGKPMGTSHFDTLAEAHAHAIAEDARLRGVAPPRG